MRRRSLATLLGVVLVLLAAATLGARLLRPGREAMTVTCGPRRASPAAVQVVAEKPVRAAQPVASGPAAPKRMPKAEQAVSLASAAPDHGREKEAAARLSNVAYQQLPVLLEEPQRAKATVAVSPEPAKTGCPAKQEPIAPGEPKGADPAAVSIRVLKEGKPAPRAESAKAAAPLPGPAAGAAVPLPGPAGSAVIPLPGPAASVPVSPPTPVAAVPPSPPFPSMALPKLPRSPVAAVPKTPLASTVEAPAVMPSPGPVAARPPALAEPLALDEAVPRSEAVEAAAREADAHARSGYELAGRGAYFSARAEFLLALRVLAEALDVNRRSATCREALSAALTALRELEDFTPRSAVAERASDVRALIAAHRTPVLKNTDERSLSPVVAMQAYLTYAQEQLATSVRGEVAGSMALRGLGKVYATIAAGQGEPIRAARPQAVAFYQAALLAAPDNYMASNDLGVLLAQNGRMDDARIVLEHSASLAPEAMIVRNLSQVYARLGWQAQAQEAARRAEELRQAEAARARARLAQRVQWVDPRTFTQTYRQPPSPAQQPAAAPPARQAALGRGEIQLCQALGPAAPCDICGVDCAGTCGWDKHHGWRRARWIAWQAYAQGEYVGHARAAHVGEYRLRPDDQLDMIYRLTREETSQPYKLNVGDELRLESLTDGALNRDLLIQPDGTITLRLLGQVRATGRTIAQLQEEVEKGYVKYYKVPAITISPLKVNAKLEDLRATVDRRQGIGGQSQPVRVTPEGTVSLPAVGSVLVQGLTLTELQRELKERYRQEVEGIEVIPVLVQRAPRYVYVLGEVQKPGRFDLTGPTTVMHALSMAGSWNVGANLRQIVIFRRGDDWRLLATMVDLHGALYGKQPCPYGELWLSDSDVVLVPKGKLLIADEFIEQVFTRGLYGVFPFSTTLNFTQVAAF